MQKERMSCILSGIKRFQLTPAETEFIAFAEGNLSQGGPPMRIVELVLEGIYSQKTKFIKNSILSMLKKEARRLHPSGAGDKVRLASGSF